MLKLHTHWFVLSKIPSAPSHSVTSCITEMSANSLTGTFGNSTTVFGQNFSAGLKEWFPITIFLNSMSSLINFFAKYSLP